MVLRSPRARGSVVVVTLGLASAYKAVARVLVEPRGDSGRFVDTTAVPRHSRLRAARLVEVAAILAEARADDTERPRKACRRSGHCNRSYECLQFPHNASHGHFASLSELVSAWIDRRKRTSFRPAFHVLSTRSNIAIRAQDSPSGVGECSSNDPEAASREILKAKSMMCYLGTHPASRYPEHGLSIRWPLPGPDF